MHCNAPWWPCPLSAEAGTLSTLHTAAAPSDQQEPIWPHTSYKDDIGDKNNIYFQFRRGREEGRLTWFLLNFLFFTSTTWWQPGDKMPVELNISVTAQWGLIVCGDTDGLLSGAAAELFAVFSVIPSFVLISHYPGLPQTLHIRTQHQPATRHCHLFSWLNSGSDGIK